MFDTYCGLSCKDCSFRESRHCGGCIATQGHPFHGQCQVAECAKARKRRFCGECGEFPCKLLESYSYDKEHGDEGARIQRCREIKAALVASARKGIDPVAVCGHHCDFCFMGQWCGGCRSKYNGCSFATLYEDGICPNVRCASEKQLDGCWQCEELDACRKGYYGQKDEYVAKATAKFLSLHGKKAYTYALGNAIKKGENYPKSFDATGSTDAALHLLETYQDTALQAFWERYLKSKGLPADMSMAPADHFEITEEGCNTLLGMVLRGEKKATSSAYPMFAREGLPLPKPGELWITTDWAGTPRCVLETTAVTVLPFREIRWELACREGEDDSLQAWRENHIRFFTGEGKQLGYEFTEEMPVVFEDFRVIYQE